MTMLPAEIGGSDVSDVESCYRASPEHQSAPALTLIRRERDDLDYNSDQGRTFLLFRRYRCV